jgi:hypothetical protein
MCVRVYVCMCVCMCVYVCMYLCMCVCVCIVTCLQVIQTPTCRMSGYPRQVIKVDAA